jgi:cation transport ATPase
LITLGTGAAARYRSRSGKDGAQSRFMPAPGVTGSVTWGRGSEKICADAMRGRPGMMAIVAVDPEQQAVQIRQAEEEARRQAAWSQQAAEDPEQQREWIRQNNVIYGGLIAIGLVLVQPFLTATTLDWPAKICVLAFSAAIPLLAALVLVNRQENFRRRVTGSLLVRVTQSIALLLAFVGVVAAFWHIMWFAGVGVLVSGFAAIGVHSAGYYRLELAAKAAAAPVEPAGPQSPDHAEE